MRFKRKKTKTYIKIEFDKKTQEIRIEVEPETVRPTEIIQTLMLAINVISQTLQKELKAKKEKKKPKKLGYIG